MCNEPILNSKVSLDTFWFIFEYIHTSIHRFTIFFYYYFMNTSAKNQFISDHKYQSSRLIITYKWAFEKLIPCTILWSDKKKTKPVLLLCMWCFTWSPPRKIKKRNKREAKKKAVDDDDNNYKRIRQKNNQHIDYKQLGSWT